MAFQTPITIKNAIDKIDRREYLLPAIQREFVWGADDIELLFDSLMRGFPINSFLFWNVNSKKNRENNKYYEFLKNYMEYHAETATPINVKGIQNFTAILDGQQRLTALYIGLKGTYAYRKPRGRWEEKKDFPIRSLYLDVQKSYLEYTEEEKKLLYDYDDGREYSFCFLTNDEFESKGGDTRFFKVENILSDAYSNISKMMSSLSDKYNNNDYAKQIIPQLYDVIHQRQLINYYLEDTEDYDKALSIFIRTNSGGEKLSFSDLLLSTIISNWSKYDARQEFRNLEKEIKSMGFYTFSKDFIVRCALLIYSDDIRFKINNLTPKTLAEFEKNWDSESDERSIKSAIKETFDLLKDYGHTENTITSYNAVVIITYYLYIKNKTNGFRKKIEYKEDREIILKWFNLVLLKRVFGGQADTILKDIRDVIKNSEDINFPINAIKRKLKDTRKTLTVDDEFLDSLLIEQKDSRYAFPILSLLYDGADYRDTKHKDHLHPEATFNKKSLASLNLSEDDLTFYLDKNNWNSILNLQLLYSDKNQSKQHMPLKKWVEDNNINCETQLIPDCLDIKDFKIFIQERARLIKDKLRIIFN